MQVLKKIKKPTLIFLANGTYSLSQLILISLIAHSYDSIGVGLYSSAMALIVPIITFFSFNIRAIQLPDFNNHYNLADYYVLRVIGSIFAIGLISLISYIKIGGYYSFAITIILLTRRLSELFSEIAHSDLIKKDDYTKYTTSIIFSSSISIMAFALGTYLFSSLIISLTFYSIIWAITFILYDAKNIKFFKIFEKYTLDKYKMKNLLVSALPLAFVASINTLYENVPRYFIEYYLGIEELGIFSGLLYLTLIGNIFITVLTIIFSTRISQYYYEEAFNKVKKTILFLITIISVISTLIYVFIYMYGDLLIRLILGNDYLNYNALLLILIIAMSVNFFSKIFGLVATSIRKNKEQLYIAILVILILIPMCFYLTSEYGLFGASYSLIIVYLIKLVLLFFVVANSLKTKKSKIKN